MGGISMQAMSIRIFLILFMLVLINPSSLQAATEQRTALVIGNSAYSSGPLKNPVNDAADMAAMLKRLGFTVSLKQNASLQEMDEAIEEFGNRLKRGGVGLYYYAGHGVQVNGVNYLLPIDAKINKEVDVKYQAVDANKILDEMATANNGLNIIILDACRDNPYGRSFRNATRGLAIVSSAPSGTFISYSTNPGNVARDGDGRNSPYTQALLENMDKPGLSINNVFMKVRSKVKKETGQVPWELSSLEGDFYFVPNSARTVTDKAESVASTTSPTDELAAEQENLRQAALERKKPKKSTTIAMTKRPSQSTKVKTSRDGRFIAYDNGTVLDTKTNLMWAAKDNGKGIEHRSASDYCYNYRGGGYTDWRMPNQYELEALYKSGTYVNVIEITYEWVWASECRYNCALFCFSDASIQWIDGSLGYYRVLPVRSGK
jgi:uncharacterized caspase-like protein